MIQTRNFLIGLGSGLILSSILFGVSDWIDEKTTPSSQPLPSAAPSGYVENKDQTQATGASTDSPPSNQQDTKSPALVKIEIKEGMTADQIADLLVQNGIITDKNAFLNAAKERVREIRIGVYELPVKGDFQQIMQTITNQ